MISFKTLLTVAFCTIFCTAFSQDKAGKKDTLTHPVLYACPKHADIKSEKPGHCSKCGMKLEMSAKEKMKREVTKNYSCPVHADVLLKHPGQCPQCGKDLVLSPKEKMKLQTVKKYTCPMHPDVTSKTTGQCPKCKMDLVEKRKQH
jgi:transcription initiation factor IIE alpha subunit